MIYPSTDGIKEHTDIVKLSVDYDISKVHLLDDFRYEHFGSDDTRDDTSVNPNQTVTVHEDYHQDAFYNTFHMDCHVNDKVYWSLGYLHSSLSGSGDMQVDTPPPVGPFDIGGMANAIGVELDSDVVNLNSMFGPFKGLILYAGLQAEKTDTHGFTDALLTQGSSAATTNVIRSSEDTKSVSETLGMRYTKIPYTTLYAEGQWNEEQIDLDQTETQDGASSLAVDSNETTLRQDYRVGFNTAPLSRMTLAGSYRHYIDHDDYDYPIDTVVGYPGFITAQDFTTDEVMAKLTLRPCSRFNVAFTYQLVSTDIRTSTEAIPVITPGGTLQSGDYDLNIYSVSATVTPMSRWYLTGLLLVAGHADEYARQSKPRRPDVPGQRIYGHGHDRLRDRQQDRSHARIQLLVFGQFQQQRRRRSAAGIEFPTPRSSGRRQPQDQQECGRPPALRVLLVRRVQHRRLQQLRRESRQRQLQRPLLVSDEAPKQRSLLK